MQQPQNLFGKFKQRLKKPLGFEIEAPPDRLINVLDTLNSDHVFFNPKILDPTRSFPKKLLFF